METNANLKQWKEYSDWVNEINHIALKLQTKATCDAISKAAAKVKGTDKLMKVNFPENYVPLVKSYEGFMDYLLTKKQDDQHN